MKAEELKLLNKDVMITEVDQQKYKGASESDIVIIESDEKQKNLQYHEVVNVSSRVTEVKVGDIILLELAKHTIPVMLNNRRYAITSEDDIVGVVENI